MSNVTIQQEEINEMDNKELVMCVKEEAKLVNDATSNYHMEHLENLYRLYMEMMARRIWNF